MSSHNNGDAKPGDAIVLQPTTAAAEFDRAVTKAVEEFPTIEKRRTAKIGHSHSYKYADLSDIRNGVVPVMSKHGLRFRQRVVNGEMLTVIRHVAGWEETTESPLFPTSNSSPQALGSAITYSRRYGLQLALGIVTEEDDDAQAAQTGNGEKRENQISRKTAQDAPGAGGPRQTPTPTNASARLEKGTASNGGAPNQAQPKIPPTTGKMDWKVKQASDKQRKAIYAIWSKDLGYSDTDFKSMVLTRYNKTSSKELTGGEASEIIETLKRWVDQGGPDADREPGAEG